MFTEGSSTAISFVINCLGIHKVLKEHEEKTCKSPDQGMIPRILQGGTPAGFAPRKSSTTDPTSDTIRDKHDDTPEFA